MPIPSLYRRSFSHSGLSGCATYCACALAARDTSRTAATADAARPLVVIVRGEGTPAYGQSYCETHTASNKSSMDRPRTITPGSTTASQRVGETDIGGT